MDSRDFDALTRSLAAMPSRRAMSWALIALAFGGALGAAFAPAAIDAKRHKRHKKKKRKKCRNCGLDRYCEKGKCKPCKDLEVACTADAQCCSGICGSYTNACAEVREGCDPAIPGQCPNQGICCDFGGDDEFKCVDDPSTNQKACGTSCEDVVNCINSGNDSQCIDGQCCCGGPNCSSLPPC